MVERGFLVPPWYVSEQPNDTDINICSMIWGFSLCTGIFTFGKASRQSWLAYKRRKLWNAYFIMVWSEWITSVVISMVSWLFLRGIIPPSFWTFFAILCLWVVQVQCILQIIINRVALIMTHPKRARHIKILVFAIVAMINVSVWCIWIPARLQISPTFVRLNEIWDRTEKAIFAVVDTSLNLYFVYLVRAKLINAGVTKYWALFRFNCAMMCISVALDLILIGSMSLSSGLVYVQFHPLVYLIKLDIELNMAELIAKIVRSSNDMVQNDPDTLVADAGSPMWQNKSLSLNLGNTAKFSSGARAERALVDNCAQEGDSHHGTPSGSIRKTVRTEVIHRRQSGTIIEDV